MLHIESSRTEVKMRRYRARRKIAHVLDVLFKLLLSLIFIFPFYWMLISAFKTNGEIYAFPPTLYPHKPTTEGFSTVFNYFNLWPYIRNTLIVTVAVMALQMCTIIPAAYAFAKLKFKGRNFLFTLVLVAQMVPTQLTFIPVYIMLSKAGILRTLWPQILPFGASAYGVFLLRQSFMQVNDELIECAQLDNANLLQIMYRVMLPTAKSTLVTVMILCFINHWNGYFWPLVMCTTETIKPISLVISRLKDVEDGVDWTAVMAGNLLLMLPTAAAFIAFSKKIIQSLAYKGMK